MMPAVLDASVSPGELPQISAVAHFRQFFGGFEDEANSILFDEDEF
jgi:hypothetical protein